MECNYLDSRVMTFARSLTVIRQTLHDCSHRSQDEKLFEPLLRCTIAREHNSCSEYLVSYFRKHLGGLTPLLSVFGGAAAPRAPLLPTPVISA